MSKNIDAIVQKALEIGWKGVQSDKWRLDNAEEIEMTSQSLRNATTPNALKSVEESVRLLTYSLEKRLDVDK